MYANNEVSIKSSKLLDNKANSSSITFTSNTTSNSISVEATFKGNDNFINAIYTTSSCSLEDVTYWTNKGETNSNDENPQVTDLEDGINITLELYDSDFNLVKTLNMTNAQGVAKLTLTRLNQGPYYVSVKHSDDNYYTEIENTTLISLALKNPNINIEANDTYYMQNTTISVNIPDATGNVTFEIDGENYTSQNLTDAFAIINVTNLAVGVHNLTVYYSGDENYTSGIVKTKFTVKPIAPAITIEVADGYYKSDILINVTVESDVSTDVFVIIEDEYGHTFTFNGTNKLQTTINSLDAGAYNITAYCYGNHNYTSASNTTNFTVKPIDLNPVASVDNITLGQDAIFEITVPNDFEGKVNITVDASSEVYDIAGPTKLSFSNLIGGEKTANLTFYDDKNYNKVSIQVNFTVFKSNPTMTVRINDTTYPSNAVCEINVTGNANGTVEIIINDTVVATGNVVNGTALIDIKGLSGGVKEAAVKFTSSDDYNNATSLTKFIVMKTNSTLIISRNGNDVTATVTDNATGFVTFIINGKNTTIKINNTNATLKDALVIGENYIVAIYEGDVNFTASRNATTYVSGKHDSKVNATATNIIYGNASEITVEVPMDQTGYVRINIKGTDINTIVEIKEGVAKFNATGLDAGEYSVNVTYLGDESHMANSNTTFFNVSKANLTVSVQVLNVTDNQNIPVIIDGDKLFNGKVLIKIEGLNDYDGTVRVWNEMGKLNPGNYTANLTFYGDNNYNDKNMTVKFTVSKSCNCTNITAPTVLAENLVRGYNSEFDYQAVFLDAEDNALINTTVEFKVNGKTYKIKTDEEGVAQLTHSKLPVGTYKITSINTVTGERVTCDLKIVKRITENRDLTMDYLDGSNFKVKVWGDDGNVAPAGEIIDITVNGIYYVGYVDEEGYASLNVKLLPKTYTIIAEYKGFKTTNKLKVKQTLKVVKKTVTVKKGKKLVLKASLKFSNGKGIKGKKITFKLNGKTYFGKTNKRGIVKVTVKNKYTKKLKKGKKYTVKVTYAIKEKYYTVKDTVKCYVKVK